MPFILATFSFTALLYVKQKYSIPRLCFVVILVFLECSWNINGARIVFVWVSPQTKSQREEQEGDDKRVHNIFVQSFKGRKPLDCSKSSSQNVYNNKKLKCIRVQKEKKMKKKKRGQGAGDIEDFEPLYRIELSRIREADNAASLLRCRYHELVPTAALYITNHLCIIIIFFFSSFSKGLSITMVFLVILLYYLCLLWYFFFSCCCFFIYIFFFSQQRR